MKERLLRHLNNSTLPGTLLVMVFAAALSPAQLCAQTYLINSVNIPLQGNYTFSGLAVDTAGDIFAGIMNSSGVGEVVRISPSGAALVVAGGGSSGTIADGALATSVGFYTIYALALDPAGTLYIVASVTGPGSFATPSLYRVDLAGAIHPMSNVSPYAPNVAGPSCSAVDKNGNLFTVSTNNDGIVILRISPIGSTITYAGGGNLQGDGVPATAVEIYPNGIAIGADGETLLISENTPSDLNGVTLFSGIKSVAPDGVISTVFWGLAFAVAADGTGNIYFSNVNPTSPFSTISSISSSGAVQIIAGGGASSATGIFATNEAIATTALAASWQSTDGTLVLINSQVRVQKLTPAPSCSYTLNPTSNVMVPASGSGATPLSVQVSVSNSICPWTATANQNWIGITSGSAGVGIGTVNYVVVANTNAAPRSGSIAIGGMTFAITQFGTGPTLTSVSNSASFAPSFAPGMLMSVFGTGLSSGIPQTVSTVPLPLASSSGTSVTINGIVAPLLYVSPTQFNLELPYEVQVGNAMLTVNSGGESARTSFAIEAAAPGIFVDAQTGHVVPNESATAGSTIALFVTGAGLVSPPEQTGNVPAGGTTPIPNLTVSMTIGGVAVTPVYVGIPSWSIGVLQINCTVPSTLAAGTQSVLVTIGGVASPPALLTVTP